MTCKPGDRVILRGCEWHVLRLTRYADCEALDADGPGARRTFLLPFDRPRASSAPRTTVVSPRRWAREVAEVVRRTFPYGGLRSCPPGIRLLPYQLEPALASLRHGVLRVLIADDVGMGKTIEAGILVREVANRDHLARVLVLCPAGLRSQWSGELEAHFELHAIHADASWLHRETGALPPDVNPWSVPGTYLASIDFVKRPEALRPLEAVRWDLLVVDEAHVATPGTDRWTAVDAIAARSRRVMLLTATPHLGDDGQFRALCRLGGEATPIALFSRPREDAGLGLQPIRSVVLPVRLSEVEERAQALLEAYTDRIRREPGTGGQARALLTTVLRKRALSCPASLQRSIRRRMEVLAGAEALPAQLTLPLSADEESPDDEPLDALRASGLRNPAEERRLLQGLSEAAGRAAAEESKLRVLARLLRRARQPALIFTEYRDTAEHVARVLAACGHDVGLLHGGLAAEERRAAVRAFCEGGRLLVATDAGSEGLNLHYRCRLVVHFDLPWTPARLHQRGGRVNRIGQCRRVHEVALVGDHTAEHLVLAPLLARAARAGGFSRAALMAQLTESRVAAHLLDGVALPVLDASAPAVPGVLTLDLHREAEEEAARLLLLRRVAGRCRGRRTPTRTAGIPVVRRLPRDRNGSHLLVLFALSLRDGRGVPLEEELLPLRLDLPGAHWARRPSTLRAQAARALARAASSLDAILEARLSARIAEVLPLRRAALDVLRRRLALDATLTSPARELVQAGLFDRRALRAARLRRMAAEMNLEDEHARIAGAGADLSPGGHLAPAVETVHGRFHLRAVMVGGPV